MPSVFPLVLILAAQVGGESSSGLAVQRGANSTPLPRDVHEIRREVSQLLKAESAAKTDDTRSDLVRQMSKIYLEIVEDDRWVSSPTLQQQRIKLWSRLTRIRNELKRRQETTRPHSITSEQEDAERYLAGNLAAHLHFAAQTMGGSSDVLAGASGGGAVVDDHADELIDLITNTIHPEHWNVNGGPGAIAYYRPAMALVVRANSEVQGNVRNVVGALRDAGK